MSLPSDFNNMQDATNAVITALTPLTPDQRRSILQYAIHLFGQAETVVSTQVTKEDQDIKASSSAGIEIPDLEEFVFSKKSDKDIERVVVLAYYLEKFRNQSAFKTSDLEELNREARGLPFGNIQKAVNNATLRNHFFSQSGNGSKSINSLGRKVAELLPDKEKVSAFIKDNKPRAKRKSTGK